MCLPSIVDEFLRQAKAARLFRVSGTFVFHDLLESDLSRAFGGFERLDLFFPFDPYLLKKSDRLVHDIYVLLVTPILPGIVLYMVKKKLCFIRLNSLSPSIRKEIIYM